ncbi:MAG: hypothetical protein IPK73_17700 [Candidatus Obscuribacter sp.]|nr:hypothetical protein [Candidatus Obscuribacter sp.]
MTALGLTFPFDLLLGFCRNFDADAGGFTSLGPLNFFRFVGWYDIGVGVSESFEGFIGIFDGICVRFN